MFSIEKIKNILSTLIIDIFDMLSFVIFVFGIVLVIRIYLFHPFTVSGQSMEPNFYDKDFLIVDKIFYKSEGLKRGDVIVFVPPGKGDALIKRIIGLPGETIKVIDNKVNICNSKGENCNILDENYLPKDWVTEPKCGGSLIKDPSYYVTDGYFVMGDHRGHTTDSMCCFSYGCYDGSNYTVPPNYILGKVYIRLFPNLTKF